MAFTLGAWTLNAPAPSKKMTEITRKGVITGWSVLADGTVSIRLAGQPKDRDFELWFATPASRTATTRYEDLILEAVMALRRQKDPATVTVTSDTSNSESGERLADALPLRGLRQE
jgi:hypothetical protein